MRTTRAMRHAVRDYNARLDAQRKAARQAAKVAEQTRFNKIAEKRYLKLQQQLGVVA